MANLIDTQALGDEDMEKDQMVADEEPEVNLRRRLSVEGLQDMMVRPLSLPPSLSLPVSLSTPLSLSVSPEFSLSLSIPLSLYPSVSFSPSPSLSLSIPLSVSLSLPAT